MSEITCSECSHTAHFRSWNIKRGELTCPLCGTPEGGKPEAEDEEPAIPQDELQLE